MSVLTVLKHPEKKLRIPGEKVTPELLSSRNIQQFIDDLIDTMLADDGIGIASTQVGRALRIFILGGKTKGDARCFVNPVITSFSSKKTYLEEGCLSVPGVYGLVLRPAKVRLKALDRNGKKIDIKASGLTAKVFQHEVDHLNGILFIDKAEKITEVTTHSEISL